MGEDQHSIEEVPLMSLPRFAAMPPAVGEVFRTLWQEIQNIHLTWMVNRQLFGTSPEPSYPDGKRVKGALRVSQIGTRSSPFYHSDESAPVPLMARPVAAAPRWGSLP